MRIDLHTHTNLSDGTVSPTDLVHQASAAGLDVVAITDHDIVTGWDEARAAGEKHGVTVVCGVEWSTTNDGAGQHLLAYGFDPSAQEIQDVIARSATSRTDRLEAVLLRLEALDRPLDRKALDRLVEPGGVAGRKHLAIAMTEQGYVKDDAEAFATYLNPGRDAYVKRYRVDIVDAITMITAAGGRCVLAHPRDVARGEGVSDDRIAQLAQAGLAGVEVDHQSHSAESRLELRALTAELGLVATGSSDFHGTRKVNHDLGCNLTAPEAYERLLDTH